VVRVLLAAVVLAAAVTGAGCASHAAAPAAVGGTTAPLAEGKGAIAGLLVDDRYRPLHLTDTPQGEYDAKGFVLVVETGATVRSGTDGTFTVADLAPGLYTLKPSVDAHEGSPLKVDVVAGKYAEADLMVRRLFTPAKDAVSVHDDTILITCQAQALDGHFTVGTTCYGDLSPSGSQNWVDYNYTGFGTPKAVVVEAKFSQKGDYEVWLTQKTNLVTSGTLYAKEFAYGSDYFRYATVNGSTDGRFSSAPVDTMNLRVWANVDYTGTQQADQATGIPVSAGFTFVVKVRLVVSAFLEVPTNLDTYQLLA